ncbi:MAG: rod shape-determining protein MreC [Eubacteriales bacterium]|nr:rod shape-determining protein MreC [Eubacteriales bacterium]
MSFFRNKPILITVVALAAAILLAAVSHFTDGAPERVAGGATSAVEGVFAKLFSPVMNIGKNNADKDELLAEIEELKMQIDELTKENRGAEEYIEENKRLKDLLGIKEQMVNKEVLTAQVISYDWDNFSETVTINRGSKDGVEKEDAVISSAGIVGRVTEVGGDWARITTILSPEHSLGIRIARTGDLAVAEGDLKLAKDKKLRLDYISGAAELVDGDIVETSGIGGIYPPDITIGRVSEIKKDNSGVVVYAVVEPAADFTRLFEVLVITDWTRESVTPDYVQDATEDADYVGEITEDEIENAEG